MRAFAMAILVALGLAAAGAYLASLDADLRATLREECRRRVPSQPFTVTDVAWADDRLLAAAGTTEEFASKIFICPTPLKHEAAGEFHSAETYHVAHGKWETKAPMSVILPYTEEGKTYVVADGDVINVRFNV